MKHVAVNVGLIAGIHKLPYKLKDVEGMINTLHNTRDVFYVRRETDLMKTAKENAYIMHIFGKIEL